MSNYTAITNKVRIREADFRAVMLNLDPHKVGRQVGRLVKFYFSTGNAVSAFTAGFDTGPDLGYA